ncbi:MAG: carboxylesterase family protein [Pseudomonadales bacterium]|nr:carboxylesterase family protein [Pseudomonadales bacterium]
MSTITIKAPAGPIVGREKNGALLFAGIPYAEAPVEGLRFLPPVPKRLFSEPYEAFKFGPAAPQTPTGGMTDSAPVRWSEECLSLNVSTPAIDTMARPVLVWIHGGGYRTGQSSIPWYSGIPFAENGNIVTVSINYRLGALGFTDLSHLGPEYENSSVNGILDQIEALRWVQKNISAFGGDPAKVTIAGESAGGFSVATLLGCPEAQGLFHRAIPQSGAAHHTLSAEASQKVTQHFLDALGQSDVIGLQAVSTQEILDAQNTTTQHFESGAGINNGLGTTVSPFYPVHGTPALPQSPLEAIHAGVGGEVAVLTGTNADETTLFGYGKVDRSKLDRIAAGYNATEVLERYRETRPEASDEELLIAITTDHMFRIPAVRLAEAREAHTPDTWMYLFNWQSRAFNGRLKATHALEIPFAFNTLSAAGVDAFVGPGESPQPLADTMHAAWIAFIRDGDPGWARYDIGTRATMIFDEASKQVDNPAAEEREAWTGVR